MNYKLHYDKLIKRANNRILDCYTERHHIIPKCLGGTDEPHNIVKLLPGEHYLAHQLLVKMYPNEPKLVYAARMMTVNSNEKRMNNKLYGWLRRKYSNIQSNNMKKRYEAGWINPLKNKKRKDLKIRNLINNPSKSDYARKINSLKNKGNKRLQGIKKSQSHILNMSKSKSNWYLIINPQLISYTIQNLTKYCKKHNLNQGNLSFQKIYKNWIAINISNIPIKLDFII